MNRVLSVALGGSIGTVLRYYLQNWALGRFGAIFPYGTLIVNILGAFFIGLAMTIFLHNVHLSPVWRVFVVTGVLGGFTTFSALTWETYALISQGQVFQGLWYTCGSLFGGMLALLMGVSLGQLI